MTRLNLTNHFLISMPSLADPNFHQTVTLLCAHNEDGAMGIVINRPLELELGEVLAQMDITAESDRVQHLHVLEGGPVQRERGFVIHRPRGDWDAMLPVGGDIGVTASRDVLSAIAHGEGPEESVVALGYAGWAAGQLERELSENAWISGPTDDRILFHTPFEKRWEEALALLGIDQNMLSSDAGHA
ncbi:MAG: YqgE/AlgH family protein [Gammaproteobacteria bacterium]|nr:YqgE/AlgH family protein [Gammaproteobacteria bacterium]